jgi:hypothetical protein
MIQSIQAGSTALYNTGATAITTGKVTTGKAETAQTATQNEDENTVTSSQGDTVTISAAGLQAAKTFTAESANRPSVAGTSEDTYTDSTAAALSSAASDLGITEYTAEKNANSANAAAVTGSSSSSSSSSSNLSEYTESELKEMLENGEITRAEYEAEINSRKQTDETTDDESDSDTATSTDATDNTDKTEDD